MKWSEGENFTNGRIAEVINSCNYCKRSDKFRRVGWGKIPIPEITPPPPNNLISPFLPFFKGGILCLCPLQVQTEKYRYRYLEWLEYVSIFFLFSLVLFFFFYLFYLISHLFIYLSIKIYYFIFWSIYLFIYLSIYISIPSKFRRFFSAP